MRVLQIIAGVYILLFFLIMFILGIFSIIKHFYLHGSNANIYSLLYKICDILGTVLAWMFYIAVGFFALVVVIAIVNAGWNLIIGKF